MPRRIDGNRLDIEAGRLSVGIVRLLLATGHVVEFLGLGQIGPDRREPLVVRRRELLAGLSPSGIRGRELGIERDSLAEVGDGRLIGLVREIGLSAGGVGFGRLRIEPDRLAQCCDRLFGILLLEPEKAPLQAGTGQLRRRGDGGLDVSHRPISVTADGRQQRSVAQRLGELGVKFERLRDIASGLGDLLAPLGNAGGCPSLVGDSELRIEFNRLVLIPDHRVVAAQSTMGEASMADRFRRFWVDLDRPIKTSNRLVVVVPGEIGQPAVEVGVEAVVLLENRVVAAVDGRQVFSLGILHLRSLHMGVGPQRDEGWITASLSGHRVEVLDRGFELPLAGASHAPGDQRSR